MFRSIRIPCALSVCLLVGAALGAVRIPAFTISDAAPAAASGMGILNYVAGQNKTIVQVILNGFEPEVFYKARFVSGTHCLTPGGTHPTDKLGNLIIHVDLGATPALGDCLADDNGDWSDAEIEISLNGVVHALGENPPS